MNILKNILLVIIGILGSIGVVVVALATKFAWLATGIAFVLYLLQFYVTDFATVAMIFWISIKLSIVLGIVLIILALGKVLVDTEERNGKGL
jgi:bacteriorhodopsin